MDALPVEILREISLACELGDLSTFLFTLRSARLFNYKTDKFIYDDYIKKNNKCNVIYDIEGIKLNFIDYDYRFDYNHIVDYLMDLSVLIKIWKENGVFKKRGPVIALFNYPIDFAKDIDFLRFLIKHPAFGPTKMITYLNNTLNLEKMLRLDENLFIKILLSPQFRPFGPYLYLRDIKKFFNSNPQFFDNYFFQLTPEEKTNIDLIESSMRSGGIYIRNETELHGFIPLHVQLIIPEGNLYFFNKVKEDTILKLHEYKSTVNYEIAYKGYIIFSRHIKTFVSHIKPDGTYNSDIGMLLKLSLTITNLPLIILCLDVFIGLSSSKVYREEATKIITEYYFHPHQHEIRKYFIKLINPIFTN